MLKPIRCINAMVPDDLDILPHLSLTAAAYVERRGIPTALRDDLRVASVGSCFIERPDCADSLLRNTDHVSDFKWFYYPICSPATSFMPIFSARFARFRSTLSR